MPHDSTLPIRRSVRLRHAHRRLVLALLVITSSAAAQSGDGAIAEAALLRPERTYVGRDQAIMVRLQPPAEAQNPELVLLDAAGDPVSGPISIRPGRYDIASLLPGLTSLREVGYLQMLDLGDPIGSPLVIQPLLSRIIPVTEQFTDDRGRARTRIVGWRPYFAEDASAESVTIDAAEPEALATLREQCILSGFRLYLDVDVLLQTSQGDIRVALRPDAAPNTVWNFLQLCRHGFYRDLPFHRIVPADRAGNPFIVQVGDPSGTGRGGPGYWLALEPSPLPHDFGVLSMARADAPDSGGGQFFICLSRDGTRDLDGQYCTFGYAVSGAENIMRLADVQLRDVERGEAVDPPRLLHTLLLPAPPRTPGFGRLDRPVYEDPPPAFDPLAPEAEAEADADALP